MATDKNQLCPIWILCESGNIKKNIFARPSAALIRAKSDNRLKWDRQLTPQVWNLTKLDPRELRFVT